VLNDLLVIDTLSSNTEKAQYNMEVSYRTMVIPLWLPHSRGSMVVRYGTAHDLGSLLMRIT
jgi:hypothetical protein